MDVMLEHQKALYRTMHQASPNYRYDNWGIKTLHRWVHILRKPPASVLDLGCGNGKLCKLLKDMGYDVTGLDIVPGPYERDYPFVEHDLHSELLPFDEGTFDYCVCFDVLEHLKTKWVEQAIWNIFRVAKQAVILVPGKRPNISLKVTLHLTNMNVDWWIGKIRNNAGDEQHYVTFLSNFGKEERLLFYG